MGKVKNKSRLARIILLVMILTCHLPVMVVNAEFKQEKEGWKKEGEDWYYFDKNGLMKNGWIWADGYWYFLNPDNNGGYGKMMTGWQWIDGRCYYFADHSGTEYPKGAMYINDRTPDGYLTDASGAWADESGIIEIPGKGIQTSASSRAISAGKRIPRAVREAADPAAAEAVQRRTVNQIIPIQFYRSRWNPPERLRKRRSKRNRTDLP